jgi:hypothetical protein
MYFSLLEPNPPPIAKADGSIVEVGVGVELVIEYCCAMKALRGTFASFLALGLGATAEGEIRGE